MSGAIERTELLQPEPAHALGSLLGVPVPDLAGGEALPLLWHWVYLLDRPAQADLGLDGHPVRGSLQGSSRGSRRVGDRRLSNAAVPFSALTYNSHRIHYDRDYAREVGSYSGLLTHGPLQALAMAEAARTRVSGTAGSRNHDFAYRLESPLFDHQGMIVRAIREDAVTVTCVRDAAGPRTASGTLRYSSESC